MTSSVQKAVRFIQERCPGFSPIAAIVLGSGLGDLAKSLEHAVCIPYELLPGFHKPKVQGHSGQFILGTLNGVPVVCLQGRAHYYEGIPHEAVKNLVRTCYCLGARLWFATNAAGSMHAAVGPGRLVVIKDHINFLGTSPLVGANEENFGPRFVGMGDAYTPKLRRLILQAAQHCGVPMTEGVYLATLGPCFETPAEIEAFRRWGADLVGMSTVPEVIVARHCGMQVAAISVVTNLAAGMDPEPLSHDHTLQGAALGAEHMVRVVRQFIEWYACQT